MIGQGLETRFQTHWTKKLLEMLQDSLKMEKKCSYPMPFKILTEQLGHARQVKLSKDLA